MIATERKGLLVDLQGDRRDGTPNATPSPCLFPSDSGNPDRSTRTDGEQEHRVSQSKPIVMFRECPFCGSTHRSPYVDELENIVMSCRDKVQPDKRGDLAAWPEQDTLPVRCETEALSRAA